jgi:phage tail sheath protein FI
MAKKGKRKRKGGGSYRSPGVYVEEVSSGSRPIEGVGTAVAAFVGLGEGAGSGAVWRRAGTLILLATGAAAGVWAWRQRAAARLGP